MSARPGAAVPSPGPRVATERAAYLTEAQMERLYRIGVALLLSAAKNRAARAAGARKEPAS